MWSCAKQMAGPSARYEQHGYGAQAVIGRVGSCLRPGRLRSTSIRNVARQVGPLVGRDYVR